MSRNYIYLDELDLTEPGPRPGHDWVCPGCARLRAPGTACVCGEVTR